jgi:hypothetical protein
VSNGARNSNLSHSIHWLQTEYGFRIDGKRGKGTTLGIAEFILKNRLTINLLLQTLQYGKTMFA